MSVNKSKINNTILNENQSQISVRGVGTTPLNTEKSNKSEMFCKIAFDYLSFTFPYSITNRRYLNHFLKLFYLDETKGEEGIGRNGYRLSTRYLNELEQDNKTYTMFLHSGNEQTNNKYNEQTAQFEFTGDGCRALEKRGGDSFPDKWKEIFDTLFYSIPHVSVTRFDFAVDVFNSDVSLDDIHKALLDRNVLSPFLKFDLSKGYTFSSDKIDLHIIDLGSKKSDAFLCIYDKKEERESIGKEIEFDSWYRFEFRFKHDKAKNFILNMLNAWDDDNSLGQFASNVIYKYLDIKDRPENGKNSIPGTIVSKDTMRKWVTNYTWIKFLGASEKATIENYYKYESSITKNARWYSRSVSKTVAKLFFSNPNYFWVFIQQAITNGRTRLKKDDLSYIADYRRKNNFSSLSGRDIDKLCDEIKLDITKTIEDYGIEIFFDDNGELRSY